MCPRFPLLVSSSSHQEFRLFRFPHGLGPTTSFWISSYCRAWIFGWRLDCPAAGGDRIVTTTIVVVIFVAGNVDLNAVAVCLPIVAVSFVPNRPRRGIQVLLKRPDPIIHVASQGLASERAIPRQTDLAASGSGKHVVDGLRCYTRLPPW